MTFAATVRTCGNCGKLCVESPQKSDKLIPMNGSGEQGPVSMCSEVRSGLGIGPDCERGCFSGGVRNRVWLGVLKTSRGEKKPCNSFSPPSGTNGATPTTSDCAVRSSGKTVSLIISILRCNCPLGRQLSFCSVLSLHQRFLKKLDV